ncbi:hypothetical protein ACI1US_02074 [Leucobacter sp. BZR 635]
MCVKRDVGRELAEQRRHESPLDGLQREVVAVWIGAGSGVALRVHAVPEHTGTRVVGDHTVSTGGEEAIGVTGRDEYHGDLFEVLHHRGILGEREVPHELQAGLTGCLFVAVLGARHHGGVRLVEICTRCGLSAHAHEVQVAAKRRLAEHVELDAVSRVREGVQEREFLFLGRPRLAVDLATQLKARLGCVGGNSRGGCLALSGLGFGGLRGICLRRCFLGSCVLRRYFG